MADWYENGLARMWKHGWTLSYALFSGCFVDDFGNLVRHMDYGLNNWSHLY